MDPQDDGRAPVRDVHPAEAAARLAAGALALDVREDDEWEAGHLDGSRHQRLDELDPVDLPRERPVVAVCRSGRRSGQAARQLRAAGLDVVNLEGGLTAWVADGRPLVTDAGGPGRVG